MHCKWQAPPDEPTRNSALKKGAQRPTGATPAPPADAAGTAKKAETVLNVQLATGAADPTFAGEGISVWTIKWAKPLTTTEETYLRVRFRPKAFARAWTRDGSGALLDIRVCDSREGLTEQHWEALASEMLPINELNMFAVVPADLKQRAASPEPRYVRLLEGSAWAGYLRRRVDKLCIYYWRRTDVDEASPFRAFLDLEGGTRGLSAWGYAGIGIIVLCTTTAAHMLINHPAMIETIATVVRDKLLYLVGAALGLGLAWLLKLPKLIKDVLGHIKALGELFLKFEDWVYRK